MGQTRIAVYDLNTAYTERFCRYMSGRFGQELALTPVYDRAELDRILAEREVNAVLVTDELKGVYPPFVGDVHVGYLTERPTGEPGEIFRYQNLRSLYADLEKLMEQQDTSVKIVAFIGTAALVGTSAAAAAYAQRLAAREQDVLYVNMSALGDISSIFQGGNQKDLQYLLGEIQAGRDLESALGAALNRDLSGVYFLDNVDAPLGLMDSTKEQMDVFFRYLTENRRFRRIVIDSSFSVNRGLLSALAAADRIVAVDDGTYTSNLGFHKIWTLFGQLEESEFAGLMKKTSILYNRFHKQYGKRYENTEIEVVGTIDMLPPAGPVQMAAQMAELEVFDEILR